MRYEYSCNIFNIWSTLRWNIPDLLSLAEPEQTLAPGAPSLPGTDWPVRPGPGRPNKPNPGEIRNISNITTLARSGQGAPTLTMTRSQFCNQKSRDTDLIFRALRNVEIENYVNVSFKRLKRGLIFIGSCWNLTHVRWRQNPHIQVLPYYYWRNVDLVLLTYKSL